MIYCLIFPVVGKRVVMAVAGAVAAMIMTNQVEVSAIDLFYQGTVYLTGGMDDNLAVNANYAFYNLGNEA